MREFLLFLDQATERAAELAEIGDAGSLSFCFYMPAVAGRSTGVAKETVGGWIDAVDGINGCLLCC